MKTFLITALSLACWPALAVDPPLEVKEAPVIDINPDGMPPGTGRTPGGAIYHLWRDGGVWHLRCGSEGTRRFSGEIRVKGGKVARLVPVVTEARRKKPRRTDRGMVNRERNRINFDFRTNGGTDGFDFQITGDDATVAFNLQIDGTALPARIAIGSEAQPAPSVPFAFPARPQLVGG